MKILTPILGDSLLDTNIIIALFAGEIPVQQKIEQANEVFVSAIAIGELYFGALNSLRTDENLQRIESFAAANAVLTCDEETARHYGAIKNTLKLKGKPIPENDIWIAAIAIQHDLVLVSRDTHFQVIEDLNLQSW